MVNSIWLIRCSQNEQINVIRCGETKCFLAWLDRKVWFLMKRPCFTFTTDCYLFNMWFLINICLYVVSVLISVPGVVEVLGWELDYNLGNQRPPYNNLSVNL